MGCNGLLRAAVVAVLCLVSKNAAAQSYYRTVPIGDRAIGMGGAYTGLADDPSAAYYNPAGLMRRDVHQFSSGLHLFALSRMRVDDGFSTATTVQDFDDRSVNVLPTFIGARIGLGPPRHGREHAFAIAYSSLRPSLEGSLFDTTSDETSELSSVRAASGYRLTYYGMSVAGATSRKLMIGGTLYLAVQNFSYSEDLVVAASEARAGESLVDPRALVESSRTGYRTFHLVPRFGLLYRFNAQWSLGVMVQAPGIPLAQKGDVRLQRTVTEPPTSGEQTVLSFEDADGLPANAPIPWEVRLGVSFLPTEQLTLTLDGSVHGRVPDEQRVETDRPPEDIGIFYASSTGRRVIGNVAIGAEHRFDGVAVQGGFFTNLSAAEPVPETASSYVSPQINMYGVSAAVEYERERFRFSTGVTFSWGRGDALGAVIDPIDRTVRYERRSALRRTLIVHVAGVFRAAKKVAKNVIEEATDDETGTDPIGDDDAS